MNFLIQLLIIGMLTCSAFAQQTAGQVMIPGYISEVVVKEEKPMITEIITPAPAPKTTSILVLKSKKVSPEVQEAWHNFINNLRSCSNGTFILKQINPELSAQFGDDETIKILGPDTDDTCLVNIMYYKEDDPRLGPNPSLSEGNKILKLPTGQECNFSEASSEAYISTLIDLLQSKVLLDTADDPNYKAFDQACSPFVIINGEKTEINPQEPLPILE